MNIQDKSWEELNCYEFDCYPDELTVTTDAAPAQFAAAVEEFQHSRAEGGTRNIEDILRELGFVAVTGRREHRFNATLKTFTCRHSHRHGESVYVFQSESLPNDDTVIKALEIDFEPDLFETIDIEEQHTMHTIPIIPCKPNATSND